MIHKAAILNITVVRRAYVTYVAIGLPETTRIKTGVVIPAGDQWGPQRAPYRPMGIIFSSSPGPNNWSMRCTFCSIQSGNAVIY